MPQPLISSDSESDSGSDNEEAEYIVEDIVEWESNETNLNNRLFEVKWLGYQSSANTWEPEQNLKKAGQILSEFCKRRDIPQPCFPILVGASDISSGNIGKHQVENFVDVNKVVDTIKLRLKSASLKRELPIEVVVSPGSGLDLGNKNRIGKKDKMVLLTRGNHLYVLVFIADESKVYIADGENTLVAPSDGGANDESEEGDNINEAKSKKLLKEERSELRQLLAGVSQVVPVKFPFQIGIDHCASLAIVIAIQFAQSYSSGI